MFHFSGLIGAGLGLTISHLGIGGLAYAHQVIMGRLLTPSEYALFSVCMALTVMIGSPLGALVHVVARQAAVLRALLHERHLRILYQKSSIFVLVLSLAALPLLIVFTPRILSHLKSSDPWIVWLCAGFIFFSALASVNQAFFMGFSRHLWMAGTGLLNVLLRIPFSAVLVLLGLGVSGALAGATLSLFIVWLLGFLLLQPQFQQQIIATPGSPVPAFPLAVVPSIIIANMALAVMTQLDMVLVNHYFSAEQAGQYAAASLLGKAVLHLPVGMGTALFPKVAEDSAQGRSSIAFLIQAASFTLSLSGAAALSFLLAGNLFIRVLYGAAYDGAGELLSWYGIAVMPMAMVMLVEQYLIAQGRVLFAWLFLAMAPIQLLAAHLWHETIWQIIVILGCTNTVLLIVGLALLLRTRRT